MSRISERGKLAQILIGSLMIVSTALLIFHTRWTTSLVPFKGPPSPSFKANDAHESNPAAGPASRNDSVEINLHPEEHIFRDPTTIRHIWNITSSRVAPDGVSKDVFLINGQFPGPTIEARSGDVLEIEVWNLLESDEEGVSIHWHGLYMRGANHMDGASAVTQCAIRPGKAFVYRFEIDASQDGTYWYHAHSQTQRGDGLYGGLVVHRPANESEKSDLDVYDYRDEVLLLIGDWYHQPAKDILAWFMDPLFHGFEPCPDSMLINGRGQFDCSMALPARPLECYAVVKPWLQLEKRKRQRLRIVNVGTFTGITLTMPDAEIQLIQLDGGQKIQATEATDTAGILYPGERMDLVVSWSQVGQQNPAALIISLDEENFQTPNKALTQTQSFAIAGSSLSDENTTSSTEMNVTTTTTPLDLQTVAGQELAQPLPAAMDFIVLYSAIQILSRQHGIPLGFLNRTTWSQQSSPSLPLLTLEREDWDKHQLVAWTGPRAGWVDIVVNNIDGTGHPFHLHGADFYVLSSWRGKGIMDHYNPWDAARPPRGGPLNTVNPLKKDTVYVPAFGYVVLRFLADNEGIWMFHCHLLWHQASGMAMSIQVLGDGKYGFSNHTLGEASRDYCLSLDS